MCNSRHLVSSDSRAFKLCHGTILRIATESPSALTKLFSKSMASVYDIPAVTYSTAVVKVSTVITLWFLWLFIYLHEQAQTRYLAHTAEQVAAVVQTYKEGRHDHHIFIKDDAASQKCAQELLLQLGLDRPSRSSLESRWSIQWSNGWDDKTDSRRRILFQW